MTVEDLQTLLLAGEGQRVEFKQVAIKPSDLAETLIAFANSHGGVVLLGVDDSGRVVGVGKEGRTHDLVMTAASHEICDPAVRLGGVEAVEVKPGLAVLAVKIPRSRRLHATHGRFLVRRGARNVALATAEVAERARRLDTGGLGPVQLTAGYQALYEVLRYDATVELLGDHGDEAILERDEEIRFLQDGVVGIYDQFWGEGEVSAEYCVEPGVVADRFQIGPRHLVLISLREIKNRGDVIRLHVKRRIVGGLTEGQEWVETAVNHRTRLLKLRLMFPIDRPPKQARVSEKQSGASAELDRRHWRVDAQGRWVLEWRKAQPTLGETYLLQWSW